MSSKPKVHRKKRDKPNPGWVTSREKLAAALGCYPHSIPRWIRDHKLDVTKLRNGKGHWSVSAMKAELARVGVSVEQCKSDGERGEFMRQQEQTKSALLRLKLQRESGELIDKAMAVRILHESHERVKMLARQIFEDELPPVTAGMQAGAVRLENRKAVDRLCALAREYAEQMEAI
jgi:hypothetical protein